MKIHIKGFILQALAQQPELWDIELASQVCQEYGKPENTYWLGIVRLCLADLNAGGLVIIKDDRWHERKRKLLFNYCISEFGLQRMRQTGLL